MVRIIEPCPRILKIGSGISVMPTAGSLTDHSHLGLSIQLVLCCVLIGSVQSLRDTVAHWSLMLCAAALGIILGETYQKPQATSGKLQASSNKRLTLQVKGLYRTVERMNYVKKRFRKNSWRFK